MFRKSVIFVAVLFVIALPAIVLAQQPDQDIIPFFLKNILSAEVAAAVASIIGSVALIKNLIKVKGNLALLVTAIVSMAYSFVSFVDKGWPFALVVGVMTFLASAGIFKASTAAGNRMAGKS